MTGLLGNLPIQHGFRFCTQLINGASSKLFVTHAHISRSFFSLPFSTKKEYKTTMLVGHSNDQLYNVIADVGQYKDFLPFFKKSDALTTIEPQHSGIVEGSFEIGIPPVVETHITRYSFKLNESAHAVSRDSRVFDEIIMDWQLSKENSGIFKGAGHRCTVVDFCLSVQFKSAVKAQLANVVFYDAVAKMVNAFLTETDRRYGRPSMMTRIVKTEKI